MGTVPAEQEPVNLLSSAVAKTPAAGRALGISHWYVAARALVEIPYDSMRYTHITVANYVLFGSLWTRWVGCVQN